MDIKTGGAQGKEVVAQFVYEGQKPKLLGDAAKIAEDAIRKKEFEGKASTQLLLRAKEGKMLLLGMGKIGDFEADALRCAAARAALFSREANAKSLMFEHSLETAKKMGGAQEYAQAIAEGCLLALYKFDKYKTDGEGKGKKLEVVCVGCEKGGEGKVREGIRKAHAVCDAANFARDVGNESGNAAAPLEIAKKVSKMAGENGIKCKIFGQKECEKEKMGLFLAVASGSKKPPVLVVLDYCPKGAKGTVCIVGKGVTFDSGGISLKPSKDMDKMKHDKCGAAAAYGAVLAASKLGLPIRVVGITPLVENMPGASATKPGDIVAASNGKTVEILNTDAEGRLILADALLHAQKYRPDAIVDMATLTGACVVALGQHAAGLMGNSPELIGRIKKAGEKTHERAWELPLWKEYFEATKGDFADLKNVGDGEAGTIVAAAFLAGFVDAKTPWAHLDIAATGYCYKPRGYYAQTGATGFGIRLLAQVLSEWKTIKKNGKG